MMVGAVMSDAGSASVWSFPIPDASGLMPLSLPEAFLRYTSMGEMLRQQPSADAVRRFEEAMGAEAQRVLGGVDVVSRRGAKAERDWSGVEVASHAEARGVSVDFVKEPAAVKPSVQGKDCAVKEQTAIDEPLAVKHAFTVKEPVEKREIISVVAHNLRDVTSLREVIETMPLSQVPAKVAGDNTAPGAGFEVRRELGGVEVVSHRGAEAQREFGGVEVVSHRGAEAQRALAGVDVVSRAEARGVSVDFVKDPAAVTPSTIVDGFTVKEQVAVKEPVAAKPSIIEAEPIAKEPVAVKEPAAVAPSTIVDGFTVKEQVAVKEPVAAKPSIIGHEPIAKEPAAVGEPVAFAGKAPVEKKDGVAPETQNPLGSTFEREAIAIALPTQAPAKTADDNIVTRAGSEAQKVVLERPLDGEAAVRADGVRIASREIKEPHVVIIEAPLARETSTKAEGVDASSRAGYEVRSVPEESLNAREIIATTLPPQALANASDVSVASARTSAIVETVNRIVETIVDQIAVTPSILKGEGEVRMVLKPDLLDGSEITLSAKDGTLTVALTPSTVGAEQMIAAALPRLETALAEHASAFLHVSVAIIAKKGKSNEAA